MHAERRQLQAQRLLPLLPGAAHQDHGRAEVRCGLRGADGMHARHARTHTRALFAGATNGDSHQPRRRDWPLHHGCCSPPPPPPAALRRVVGLPCEHPHPRLPSTHPAAAAAAAAARSAWLKIRNLLVICAAYGDHSGCSSSAQCTWNQAAGSCNANQAALELAEKQFFACPGSLVDLFYRCR